MIQGLVVQDIFVQGGIPEVQGGSKTISPIAHGDSVSNPILKNANALVTQRSFKDRI